MTSSEFWFQKDGVIYIFLFYPLSTTITPEHYMENEHRRLTKVKMTYSPGWCSSVDWVWAANQRSVVQFPGQAHAWIEGQVPDGGHMSGNHTLMFLYSFSFPYPPLSLKINKIFLKKEKKVTHKLGTSEHTKWYNDMFSRFSLCLVHSRWDLKKLLSQKCEKVQRKSLGFIQSNRKRSAKTDQK